MEYTYGFESVQILDEYAMFLVEKAKRFISNSEYYKENASLNKKILRLKKMRSLFKKAHQQKRISAILEVYLTDKVYLMRKHSKVRTMYTHMMHEYEAAQLRADNEFNRVARLNDCDSYAGVSRMFKAVEEGKKLIRV